MVTTRNYEEVRPNNFGIRNTTGPLTIDAVSAAIYEYDAADAAAVSRRVREECELKPAVDQICALYDEVLAEARETPLKTGPDCDRDIVRYLEQSAPRFKKTEGELVHAWAMRAFADEKQLKVLNTELEDLRTDRSRWMERSLAADRSLAKIRRKRQQGLLPMPVILGAPRSGTTLLRFMLDAHPLLAIPPETGFFMGVKSLPLDADDSREALFELITNFPPQGPTWEDFGLARESLLTALNEIEPFDIADGLRAFYRLYAASQGKQRFGDKTPLYCEHIGTIRRILPEARFIHLIRDGRDTALSLRPLWFSPGKDIATLAHTWKRLVRAAREESGPDYLEIRYERLLTETETVLHKICEFIDLPFDSAMLRYFERTPERIKQHGTKRDASGAVIVTHEQRVQQDKLILQPPQKERIDRWKEDMTPQEQSEFSEAAGDLLKELGYEL
jgi:hypothetical protein